MDENYSDMKIGFFGHGKMFEALSAAFVIADLVKPRNVFASNLKQESMETTSSSGMVMLNSNIELVKRCDVVVISVKPHIVPEVLKEVQEHLHDNHIFVSIAAGITLDKLQHMLPPRARLVRTLPNIVCMVQCGVTVFSEGRYATESDIQTIQNLFSSTGTCERVPEKYMDVCTAVTVPAAVFVAIEALSDGGVKMGLPRNQATRLAAQTIMGGGKMALETGKHPGELKDGVCSPGGCSIRTIHELEKGGFRASLISAVEAATLHCHELNKV